MSKLLIVESPTKARTISRMLGNDFKIIASMGHVRDLPEHAFGIDIANSFTPEYTDTPRSRQILKELRSAAASSDEIFLATDPDREGEAIAWHLKNALSETMKKKTTPFHRITFHEITRSAIEQAIANRSDIDLNLVDAQQARRVLDRIVGYQVSPLLWRKLEKGSSAGRVQSAALRMVVERERAVLAFVPEEYWSFAILFATAGDATFKARLFKIGGKEFHVKSIDDANALEAAVRNGSAPLISDVSRQERKRNPYPPYTTSTLQQAANQVLRFSASNTMRYAQQLYEGVEIGTGESVGLITYMRTDSVTIAKEAQIAARDFISATYGAEFVPAKFNVYKNKAAAQEAHEAIRPTDVRRTPEQLAPYLDPQQLKLYTLIWKRFVASQMVPAKQELITADVNISGNDGKLYTFRSSATVTTFPGFLKLTEDQGKSAAKEECDPAVLKNLQVNTNVSIRKFDKEQKFTEPPPRFTEASLIKQLEENGIGRPSTYATILRTIQDRDYVKREQGKLIPTELGFTVNDFLVEKLPELFDIGFTAQMEQQLDDVEAGTLNWVDLMTEFYSRFAPWVEAAKNSGAPPVEKAREILGIFDNITFVQPQKVGPRKFDDAKFVNSIREKFAQSSKLSEKQYQALTVLAARYIGQIDRSRLSADLNAAIDAALSAEQEKAEKLKNRPPAPDGVGYAPVFAAFSDVEFAAPRTTRKNAFSEEKFFNSLKKQSESGSALSEKQLAALKRMAIKYQQQLKNKDEVFKLLQIDEAELSAGGENNASAPAASPVDCAALLAQLAKVTTWAPAEKRGRFTFDDKKFYQSLAKQYGEKKQLSDKQIAALQKLAEKYLSPTGNKA